MNLSQRLFLKPILPLLLLTGLYACSTSQPRPIAKKAAPTAPVASVNPHQQTTAPKKIQLKASHPLQYTVKKGDTLWDIASLFLRDPWYWPQIWQSNPQVKNPHLIYPGDILTLTYVNGNPHILLNRSTQNNQPGQEREVKLSPRIRATALVTNIPSIPADAIRQFLNRPRVVTKKQLKDAPYIVGSDDTHLILGVGNRVYIRGEIDKERTRFAVFHPGRALIDPETKKVLGYEAEYAGDIHISKYGDPATGKITFNKREILIGDRLLPEDKSKLDSQFFPKPPDVPIDGRVVSLFDALFGVGEYQVLVINKGERDGLEVGNLLATYAKGNIVHDSYGHQADVKVRLPDERSGLIMIFKTFDRVSYALVLNSTRIIHTDDRVATP